MLNSETYASLGKFTYLMSIYYTKVFDEEKQNIYILLNSIVSCMRYILYIIENTMIYPKTNALLFRHYFVFLITVSLSFIWIYVKLFVLH